MHFPKCKLNCIPNFPISNDNFKFDIQDKLKFKNADLLIYQPMNKNWKSEKK